jgi:hypothetical protein
MPPPQAELEINAGYSWTVDLDAADRGSGQTSPYSVSELGADTAQLITGSYPSAALYDGGTAASTWSISATQQHFSMSALSAGYGNNSQTVADYDGYSQVVVWVQAISTDYITNTSTAPVTVKFSDALDTVSPPEGELNDSGFSWQIDSNNRIAASGTVDFTSSNGAGAANYSYTIPAGQTVTWYTNYLFEGTAGWAYSPPPYGSSSFVGYPLSYDCSSTGIVHADELDGSGDLVAGNPDLSFASGVDFSSLACFAAGTLILTARGGVPVEALRAGDLIPIRYLVNGATIAQMPADQVTYWHVELPAHGVIYAEGLAAESYLDTGNRAAFANAPGATMMTPDFASRVWEARSCARLVREGEALRAARVALLERAEALGHATTGDPALHVVAGGHVISPLRHGDVYRFAIPGRATRARVVSRSAIPAAVRACGDDHRRLGVAVSRLTLDGEVLALSDARLGDGWHQAEPGWRWTNGDAALTIAGGSLLDIELAITERYWLPAPSPRLMGSGVR